jgi:cysteine desulfurase
MSRFVLDCAVCRPVDEEVARWLTTSAQRAWAPTVAGYHEGKVSQALLEQSATALADVAGGAVAWFAADPTTGLRSAVDRVLEKAGHPLLTSQVDTVAVLDAVHDGAVRHGVSDEVLGVDSRGRIHPDELARLRTPAVMVTALGNQEIGTVQQDLSRWKTESRSTVILDARTAFGWTALPDYWDLLILDPRAWGAPAGASVVVARTGRAPRSDFDNVPAAITAGLAGQRWLSAAPRAAQVARNQVATIRRRLLTELSGVQIHGGEPDDLPHILSVSILYVDAEAVQTALDARGYAVGSGSACASRSGQPSHVLAAIGGLTSGNLRIGLPPDLGDDVVDGFVQAVVEVVNEVREQMGTQNL